MRWKNKTNTPPKIGDTRVVRKFLLFPKSLSGETRWLEKANIIQKLIESCHPCVGVGAPVHCERWIDVDWSLLENKPKTKRIRICM